eukprot:COSAG01_NODE_62432_length_284_cov_1.664865_2_plen_40_part_01
MTSVGESDPRDAVMLGTDKGGGHCSSPSDCAVVAQKELAK